ncbi:hypothetical protein ABBQ32_008909 [Trebouxia sp. C0010 RCD-2024]
MSVLALRQLLLAELGQRDFQRCSDKHLQNLIERRTLTRGPCKMPHARGCSPLQHCLQPGGQAPQGMQDNQQAPVSFWAKSYRQQLQALPAPESFGKVWSAFQTPQGNLLNEVDFDRHGPLLNIYRPRGAKPRIKQLIQGKLTYHITPETGKSWVAKVVAMTHAWQLHQQLSKLDLAPQLTGPLEQYPGGVAVIQMEYLDPADGWVPLERFSGDRESLQDVALNALK